VEFFKHLSSITLFILALYCSAWSNNLRWISGKLNKRENNRVEVHKITSLSNRSDLSLLSIIAPSPVRRSPEPDGGDRRTENLKHPIHKNFYTSSTRFSVLISIPNSKSPENLPKWLDREKGWRLKFISLASDFRSGSGVLFLFSFLCFFVLFCSVVSDSRSLFRACW
jgi:hypothetical protein